MNQLQIRLAMYLTGWTVRMLADRYGVPISTIQRIKYNDKQAVSRDQLREFFEGQGLVFIDETEGHEATVARRKGV